MESKLPWPGRIGAETQLVGLWELYFLIRANGNPGRLIPSVKAAVAEVDQNTPAADMATIEQGLDNQTRTLRFYMFLLGIFATVAVLMAATGIYGGFGLFCHGAYA